MLPFCISSTCVCSFMSSFVHGRALTPPNRCDISDECSTHTGGAQLLLPLVVAGLDHLDEATLTQRVAPLAMLFLQQRQVGPHDRAPPSRDLRRCMFGSLPAHHSSILSALVQNLSALDLNDVSCLDECKS